MLPVLKHIPGHGRATADSHFRLPVVDADRANDWKQTDFAAFRPLADLPLAMTAHVVFSAIDPAATGDHFCDNDRQVIRGSIGFEGLLMSDDVSMGALSGTLAERTPRHRRGGLRSGAALQRQARRDARGRGRGAGLAGEAAAARRAALACAQAAASRSTGVAARGGICDAIDRTGAGTPHDRGNSIVRNRTAGRTRATDEPALVVDVEGFEGPLDLLLTLARQQKVDLAKISILALADQYLAFIEEARKLRLELAADYLVMAAWLAYLKSRLLLPEPRDAGRAERRGHGHRARLPAEAAGGVPRGGEPADEPAAARSATCSRAAIRSRIAEIKHPQWTATLYDLLSAYAAQRQQRVLAMVHLTKRTVWSLAEARASLERLIGMARTGAGSTTI